MLSRRSVFPSVIAVYPTKLLRLLLHLDGGHPTDAPGEEPFPSEKRTDMPSLVRASRSAVRPGTLWESITDERLERIVRALLPITSAVALIFLLGSPPAVTDATAPYEPAAEPQYQPAAEPGSDATKIESSAPFAETPARFLTSSYVSEALARRGGLETVLRAEIRADDAQIQTSGVPHEFYFSRVAYSGFGGFYGGGRSWATDYPKADQIFLSFIERLLPNLDAYNREFVVQLHNPDLRRFPFLYALEVGRMSLMPPEVEGLRSYLLQGGFLVIDDFWGSQEWAQFEYEIRRVLPEFQIVDLPLDHNIFTAFYDIDEIIQVPNVGNGTRGGPTYERDGYIPMVKGIFDDQERLMVVINWNTDLGDAWEWADDPYYPIFYSTYAYEMGVNFIVYAMSH